MHADDAGIKFTAIAEPAVDRALEVVRLGYDPAIRADNDAEGHVLAVVANAHRAGARAGDDLAEVLDEFRIGSQEVGNSLGVRRGRAHSP